MATANTTAAEAVLSPVELRHAFSIAMSSIYQSEVPLYLDLLHLVASVNDSYLKVRPDVHEHMKETGQLERLHYERHGAIRLGTPQEMALMARFLGLMDMQPVGYYDLSQPPANLPIFATCYRCLDLKSLSINPFRMFVSLLRPELITSESLRRKTQSILSRRSIFSDRALQLITAAEQRGGRVFASEASEFIQEGLKTFKWSGQATVTLGEYHELREENPLLADIVCFPGPHINHLTPRTLDIDAVQKGMEDHHIPMKEMIEGPPKRECPILLRQTSFKALEENVYFPIHADGSRSEDAERILGHHTARFGEIEQRGAALTEKGRATYDWLVGKALSQGITAADQEAYREVFKLFPDSWSMIREQGLAYFRYYPVGQAPTEEAKAGQSIESLICAGQIAYEPLTYEDFLPLSAAGIFQSNLNRKSSAEEDLEMVNGKHKDDGGREALQVAIGKPIINEFKTYEVLQKESLEQCKKHFNLV